jgi:leucyl/phenylalanyl-tRNA--protein transferase
VIVQLDPASISFPPTATALHEPNGLLAVGGDLSPGRLIHAYQQGIFPWFSDNDPILWWSPNPRAVFFPDKIHVSRSLAKANRKHNWQISINRCFVDVVRACADQRSNNEGTWITEEMIEAYCKLHKLGHAHSVEVWFDNELAGGLYGISVGRAFCGESMFHYKTDASKIALVRFAQHFNNCGGQLIDCQVGNPHLFSLGAVNLHRERFLMKLNIAQQQSMPETFWQTRELSNFGEL